MKKFAVSSMILVLLLIYFCFPAHSNAIQTSDKNSAFSQDIILTQSPSANLFSNSDSTSFPGFWTGVLHGLTYPLRYWGIAGLEFAENRSDGYTFGTYVGFIIVISFFVLLWFGPRLVSKIFKDKYEEDSK